MEALVGLLLMLLGVSSAVETSCDGRQDGAECFGALGGAVKIQLMDDALEIFRFHWEKGDSTLVGWRNKTILKKAEGDRYLFTPSNGTVMINNLNRDDSGKYELDTFDSDGNKLGDMTLQLSLKAPVSSVQLVSECLSQGQMNVSCSSEGHSPQYSWTLDGHTLTDSELLSGNNQTNVIVLRQNISGRLVCSVRNQISQSSREKNISTCGFIFLNCTSNGTHISDWVFRENNTLCVEPTSVPTTVTHSTVGPSPLFICGIRFLLVVLLLIGISLYFTWRKKKQEQVTRSVDSEDQTNSVTMVEISSAT